MTKTRPVFKQPDQLGARVDDPAVRLVRADGDSIRTLVLKVSSLARAETTLRESGMLGTVTDDRITIAPSKLEGLDVRLVQ
jgi:hypothetical protein